MTLPFKPHVLALVCCAGLLAASGVLYVKSRTPEAPVQPVPAAVTPQEPATATAPALPSTFTTAQIDRWVAPIALYPDSLLSQVLMASTYPANVVQAVQWSHDNPTLQGDKAIQAASGQPWDPSVKSLVAFPQLMALLGEDPEWVQNLGDAFLAQPQDVMDSVQRLRLLAQQTGTLKSTPQQTVSNEPITPGKEAPAKSTSTTTVVTPPAPAATIIKIEPADPQVVYVPSYNPTVVYGAWPNTAYPPVYLPPPPGQQFVSSFANGLGFSLGVATTYALFSNIDWDDDDHHHHYDNDGYNRNGDNINIHVNNFNRISGQSLAGNNIRWQHNPAYRNNVPYRNEAIARQYHRTNVANGLSATQRAAVTDEQRQAARNTLQQRTGKSLNPPSALSSSSRDTQRKAAASQLQQIARRDSYRGYDTNSTTTRRDAAKTQFQQRLSSPPPEQRQQRQENARQRVASTPPEQRQQRQENVRQRVSSSRASALSGNDSRSPDWQVQQRRGSESRQRSHISSGQRSALNERISDRRNR
ncbi:DUF3300 domain-containing protein [Citrobacter amalonaticus]|uniref:DUF3300 domain-containing protein n=1 Tax=Citrobacter amalonaticus TaxID=35703 RepID=A0A2S4RWX6_CITAM|nr:DUF3300 domain-containing protein [Citrobacter amalonaticus]POT55924.1 DUF3300 domain-containing protein [Citrobacter amalonaticus]POT74232.1 DUF3300 domain-containing protein [Citrobacter amalonaticus]POU65033.1 DUF3300 domain-containing protein [Citrobacter amalonaticus]POV03867.1 DUF3300 domain-containing protein [Citrobacter amalonaticus]